MPSVDLRPLLPPSPDHNQRSTDSPVDGKRSDLNQTAPPAKRIRFTGPQLANLAFVLAACFGALFSAAYLFKGDELFHEVAAWPRELFSGRPAVINPTPLETENSGPVVSASPLPDRFAALANNSGDPFSSSRKLLGLDPASRLTPRPNDVMSFPNSSAGQPSKAVTADGDALPSGLTNGVTTGLPQSSVAPNAATTVAPTTAGSVAQAANTAATTASSRAARSANRVAGTGRTATARRASRAANFRSARPSPFKRALAAIARSFRGPNEGKQKAAQTRSTRGQSSARTARANRARLANHRSIAAQRRSSVTNRVARSAKTGTAKSSIRTADSRKGQPSSKFVTRSAITSRSGGTMGSGFSRAGGASIGFGGTSGFSSSADGFRSLGSMGAGHGFGGGGGRMGLGGHGLGARGR